MSVTLTPEAEDRIQAWIETGRFATIEEAITPAIRAFDDLDREQRLRSLIRPAEEQTREGRVAA